MKSVAGKNKILMRVSNQTLSLFNLFTPPRPQPLAPTPLPLHMQTNSPVQSSSTIHHDKGKELSAGYKASSGCQSGSSTVISAKYSSLS